MHKSHWRNGIIGALVVTAWFAASMSTYFLGRDSIAVRIAEKIHAPVLRFYNVIFWHLHEYHFVVYDNFFHRLSVWIGASIAIGFLLGVLVPAAVNFLKSKVTKKEFHSYFGNTKLSVVLLCWMTIIALVLSALVIYRRFGVGMWSTEHFYMHPIFVALLLTFLAGTWAMTNIIKAHRTKNEKSTLILCFILSIFALFMDGSAFLPYSKKTVCQHHLANFATAFGIERHGGKWPNIETWNDDILPSVQCFYTKRMVISETHLCPNVKKANNENICSYAINSNVRPDSPSNVVLLFESKLGWNQHGGPELLAPENHKGKGCNILFNNARIEFIKTEDFPKLRWK